MIPSYLCFLFICDFLHDSQLFMHFIYFYMIPNYLYLWFLEFEQALRFYFSVVIIN